MNQISVFDAKNKLSALLDEVEAGGEITITRRGKPVARLVSAEVHQGSHVAERLRALRDGIAARGTTLTQDELRSYRDEGRR